jgi:hypothetical protein
VDAGGGPDNQDDRGDGMPTDEQQIRLGRARIARGDDPLGDQNGISGGLIGANSPRARENDPVAAAPGLIGGPPMVSPMASPVGGVEAIDMAPRFRPWSDPSSANPGPMRCHFLRSVGPDGKLTEAQMGAVPTHRCAAFGDPLPLSMRQQELVCLQRVHVSCPRYVRGTLLANETPASPANAGTRKRLPILSILGIGLVVLAIAMVAAAILGLPPFSGATGSRPAIALGTPSAAIPTSITAANPTATPTVTSIPSAVPSAAPSARPSATVVHSSPPTPAASAWPPGATASRMKLVVPCTGQANCYVYIVRGSGPPPAGNGSSVPDSLTNVAAFFGVSVNEINALNPWASAGIHAGDKLKIPPPTR